MEPFEKRGMDEKGLAHVFAAFGYSMAGLRFLLKEEAARLEIVLFAVGFVLFLVCGVGLVPVFGLFALFALVLSAEAINTSIELIVDRVSPERSDFAKHAKDLGSFAVFCLLSVSTLYMVAVLAHRFGLLG